MKQSEIARQLGVTPRCVQLWKKQPGFPIGGTIGEMKEWQLERDGISGTGRGQAASSLREQKLEVEIEKIRQQIERNKDAIIAEHRDEIEQTVALVIERFRECWKQCDLTPDQATKLNSAIDDALCILQEN